MTRVFLQPFWAWKQACKTAGRPPKLVRVLAALLQLLWGKRYTQFSPFTPVSRWWGASDASASEEWGGLHRGMDLGPRDTCQVRGPLVSRKGGRKLGTMGIQRRQLNEAYCSP